MSLKEYLIDWKDFLFPPKEALRSVENMIQDCEEDEHILFGKEILIEQARYCDDLRKKAARASFPRYQRREIENSRGND